MLTGMVGHGPASTGPPGIGSDLQEEISKAYRKKCVIVQFVSPAVTKYSSGIPGGIGMYLQG